MSAFTRRSSPSCTTPGTWKAVVRLFAGLHIQGAYAPLADWVVGDAKTLPKCDGLGPVEDRAKRSDRGVSDYRVKEAGAYIAVGLQHGEDPRCAAAGRDVALQSAVSAEVRHNAAQLFGSFQNEPVGRVTGDQRFHFAVQSRELGRHVGLPFRGPLQRAVECARTQVGRQERERAEAHAAGCLDRGAQVDRKSTRLNSSHLGISYAVFCL